MGRRGVAVPKKAKSKYYTPSLSSDSNSDIDSDSVVDSLQDAKGETDDEMNENVNKNQNQNQNQNQNKDKDKNKDKNCQVERGQPITPQHRSRDRQDHSSSVASTAGLILLNTHLHPRQTLFPQDKDNHRTVPSVSVRESIVQPENELLSNSTPSRPTAGPRAPPAASLNEQSNLVDPSRLLSPSPSPSLSLSLQTSAHSRAQSQAPAATSSNYPVAVFESRLPNNSSNTLSTPDLNNNLNDTQGQVEMSNGNFIPTSQARHMRACMVCSVVRTYTQFLQSGCPNCDAFLELTGNSDAIQDCTSQVFEGLMTVSNTSRSWVARYQRLEGYVPGVYAVQVEGILPEDAVVAAEQAGVHYIPRDGSVSEALPNEN